jgi:hypothetical protein
VAYKNPKKEKYLKNCIDKAKIYNGLCVSKEFVNSRTKLDWKCCNEKHPIFSDYYTNVVNGMSWCKRCEPLISDKLELAKFLAKSKGGEILEEKYLGSTIRHKWKCKENHIFEVNYNAAVLRGRWCVFCANQVTEKTNVLEEGSNNRIDRLDIAKEFAAKKGGKCLSEYYKNSSSKLLWKCSNEKHKEFESTYNCVINQSRWCPECSEFHIHEERVRNILNNIFNAKFIKSYPNWNINIKTGKILELDGFSEELNIAFEYQGRQHFEAAFNKSIEEVLMQKERDKIKKENCNNNNIKLIIIKANRHRDNYKTTMTAILDGIKKIGIKLPLNPLLDKKNEEIYNKTTNFVTEKKLEECVEYAKLRNGVCLSESYVSSREKMLWKCENKDHHSWLRSYEGTIKNKTWCPSCRKKDSFTKC